MMVLVAELLCWDYLLIILVGTYTGEIQKATGLGISNTDKETELIGWVFEMHLISFGRYRITVFENVGGIWLREARSILYSVIFSLYSILTKSR